MGDRQISWVSQAWRQYGKTCVGNEILDSSAQFQPRQPTSPSKKGTCLFATSPEQMTHAIALTYIGHIA
jgi:hypothetical protein